MPTYSYRAIDADSREVSGSVDAPSLDAARQALLDMHLEVIEVNEAMRLRRNDAPAATEAAQTTFAFEATDSSGTLRRGTLQSQSKRGAFDRLKSQGLTVSVLSPLGVASQSPDPDLASWQQNAPTLPVAPKAAPAPVVVLKAPPSAPAAAATESKHYLPILATLRLYAAWLLAWYALFLGFGYYVHVRELPWDIPFVEGFLLSETVYSIMRGIFLFLVLSALHRALRAHLIGGAVLTVVGCALFFALK